MQVDKSHSSSMFKKVIDSLHSSCTASKSLELSPGGKGHPAERQRVAFIDLQKSFLAL